MDGLDNTFALAQYLSHLSYDNLPEQVVLQAKNSVLNALGCGIGYSHHGPAQKAMSMVETNSGPGVATMLGRSQHASIENAMLINGIALTTADYDDTHLRTVIHPSGTPLAALISFAEANHMTGKDFLLAFVCGVETQCAVGNAISPSHYRDGWHITGTTGSFGAASAMAKAHGLSPNTFANALGHAASMAGGVRAMFGTDTKTLHMGRGAQNGLLAAQLASHGFESCPKAIESWARLVSSTVNEHEISALARAGRYQILENTYKPYPCGIVIHPLIDAALHAHADMGLSQSQRLAGGSDFLLGIQSIEAFVNPQCVRLCSIRHPKTGLETIFSLYHGIAVALVHGKAGPEEFSDAGCRDELTMQLRDKIRVHIDPDIADDAATLRIVLLGVDQREYHVAHAAGSLAKPMSSKQLEEKFLLLSSPILGKARATELVARCWALDRENDVQNFVQMLAASIDVLDE